MKAMYTDEPREPEYPILGKVILSILKSVRVREKERRNEHVDHRAAVL